MPAPSTIRCYVTEEGRELIIDALANNANGSAINTICTARLANSGDESTVITTFTTANFQTNFTASGYSPTTIGNPDGFLNVSNYKTTASPYNTITFYICIPPATGSAVTCNELMVYADPNPLINGGDETGFIYATFPAITKTDTDGLQFEITLDL